MDSGTLRRLPRLVVMAGAAASLAWAGWLASLALRGAAALAALAQQSLGPTPGL